MVKNIIHKARYLFILVTTCLCLSCSSNHSFSYSKHNNPSSIWDGVIDASWYDSKEDTFVIKTANDLAGLSYLVNNGISFNNKLITLGNDIYLNDISNFDNWLTSKPNNIWTPIGSMNKLWNTSYSFEGSFDGLGHTIYGMYIDDNVETDSIGLFGMVHSTNNKNYIANFKISNSFINVNESEQIVKYIGSVAGTAYYTTYNSNYSGLYNVSSSCYINVANKPLYVGGLVGLSAINIYNSLYDGQISIGEFVPNNFGGISGGGAYPYENINCAVNSDLDFMLNFRLKNNGAISNSSIPIHSYFVFPSNALREEDCYFAIGNLRNNREGETTSPHSNGYFDAKTYSLIIPNPSYTKVNDAYVASTNYDYVDDVMYDNLTHQLNDWTIKYSNSDITFYDWTINSLNQLLLIKSSENNNG